MKTPWHGASLLCGNFRSRNDALAHAKKLIGYCCIKLEKRDPSYHTLSDVAVWLVSVQILDGIAAGSLDALIPLVLADVTRGTGRYNLARGMLGTVQGVAGSLSNVVAGVLVVGTGYSATFLVLAAVAAVALVVLVAMPETNESKNLSRPLD